MAKKVKAGKWIAFAIVLVVFVAVQVAINIFEGYGNLYFGGPKAVINTVEGTENWDAEYYKADYPDYATTEAAAGALVEKIEAEGIVLLKNNGVLPLSKSQNKVTVFGRDAADPVYGGSGSGGVDANSAISFEKGMKANGFEINPDVWQVLVNYCGYTEKMGGLGPVREYDHPKTNIVMDDLPASVFYIGELPVTEYDGVRSSFASYNDAAIVMIGRGGGEGGDLCQDMNGWDDNYVPGQHQLELNKDEWDTIELAKANFDKVIVLINASTQMELGELNDDNGVDAIVWIGSPGQSGFNSVAKVLNGDVNPSGKTPDIYARDFTKDPTFVNFGDNKFTNINSKNAIGDACFVQYEEGIYVGYRYYETAAVEGFINYDKAVVYPFGYGLSYTSFDWQVVNSKTEGIDGNITVDVKVTNTGKVAGKDVVELYYSAPYYKGGIEKSAVNLAAFAKTNLLQPGESQTLTLTYPVEEMASYDYKNKRCYVLEHGEYKITVQSDSHNVKAGCAPISYTVRNDVVFDENNKRNSDKVAAVNQMDDVSEMFTDTPVAGKALNMSRADFAGTFPTRPTDADKVATDAIIKAWNAYKAAEHLDPVAEAADAPTFGAKNGISLITMRGVDFDDPLWEPFLDQFTVDEIVHIIMSGAYNTAEAKSVSLPPRVDYDGPAGFTNFMTGAHGMAYTSEVVLAATWNVELAREMGLMIGNEAFYVLPSGIQGWYAPAMNCHRSPFAGRNFEYYSEDGLLAGKLAAQIVEGSMEKGCVTFIKHFVLNDQESNRVNNGNAHWANEQAIREIYMRPFEIATKEAKTTLTWLNSEGKRESKEIPASLAVMSSFNRVGSTWSGGYKPVQETVLRGEWGFEGFVLTDFNLYDYMYTNQAIHNGTDVMLTFEAMKSIEDKTSKTALTDFRKVAHRLSYTAANSVSVNNMVPGATVSYKMATWQVIRLICSIVICVCLCCWCVLNVIKTKKELDA